MQHRPSLAELNATDRGPGIHSACAVQEGRGDRRCRSTNPSLQVPREDIESDHGSRKNRLQDSGPRLQTNATWCRLRSGPDSLRRMCARTCSLEISCMHHADRSAHCELLSNMEAGRKQFARLPCVGVGRVHQAPLGRDSLGRYADGRYRPQFQPCALSCILYNAPD